MPGRKNLTNPWPKRENITKTQSRERSLAMTDGSMHMMTEIGLAMTHQTLHALEVIIHNLDGKLSLYQIAKLTHALLHADRRGIVHHQPRSTKNIKSSSKHFLEVNVVKWQHPNERLASQVSTSSIPHLSHFYLLLVHTACSTQTI